MATNGYVKVVSIGFLRSKIVELPDLDEDGNKEKHVAIPGFINYQEFFFFDNRNPGSVKQALKDAQDYVSSKQTRKQTPRLSIYNPPTKYEGPWSGLPFVGQGLGDSAS